jgi:hypothetical protein
MQAVIPFAGLHHGWNREDDMAEEVELDVDQSTMAVEAELAMKEGKMASRAGVWVPPPPSSVLSPSSCCSS